MDDTESLSVVFGANIDQITAAGAMIDSIFQNVASSAESSGSDITSSMTAAAESLASISEAATGISTGIEEGVAGASEAISTLAPAGEEAGASIADSITAASSGFAELSAAADEASSSIVSSSEEASSSISSIGASAQAAASTAQDAGNGFNLGGMVNQANMAIFNMQNLGNTAQQLASSLLTPAATAETTQLSFTTLMHSASAAKQEMQNLNTYASGTPMQTQWVDGAAAKLLAFQFQSKDIIPDITAIGDSLSGLGKLSEPSLNSIVDIFGKIQASGKLTGGDMMQLSNWGIPAWQALSESMGKPIPVLQAMVSKGLIPASDALPDLTKGMESVFGGGMQKQANTFVGLISTLQSNFQIAMATIGGPALKLAETGLSHMGDILASPGFQSFASTAGQGIADALQHMGQVASVLSPIFEGIGIMIKIMAFNISDFVSSSAPAIGALQQFGTLMVSLVIGAVNLLLSALDSLELIVLSVAKGLSSSLSPALQIAGQYYSGLLNAIEPVVNAIEGKFVPAVDNLMQAVSPILSSTLQWIANSHLVSDAMSVLGTVVTTVVTDLSGLIDGLAQTITFFSQNHDAAAALIVPIGLLGGYFTALAVDGIISFVAGAPAMIAGFLTGAAAAWTMAAGVLAATWPFLLIGVAIGAVVALVVLAIDHWSQIVDVLTTAWGAVSGFFVDLWGKVTGTFQKVVGDVTGFVTGLWDNVSNLFQGGVKKVSDTLGGIGNFFKNAGATATTNAKSGWDNVVDAYQAGNQKVLDAGKWLYDHNYYVKAVVDKAVEVFNYLKVEIPIIWNTFTGWLVGEWQTLVSTATERWTAVSTAIQTAFSTSVAFVENIWNTISTVFVNAWTNYIQKPLTSAWKAVSDFFSDAWKNWIIAPLTSFWQSVSGFFSAAWDTYVAKPISDFWGKFSNNVSKAWSILTGDFHSLWTSISNWFGGLAHDAIQWGVNIINNIGAGIQSGIAGIGSTISNIGSNAWHAVGGHAAGGYNLSAGWSVVGEQGPELQYTPQGASILPNNIFQSMMSGQSFAPAQNSSAGSGSAGGNTTHVHLYFDGQEMASVLIDPLMNKVVKQIRIHGGGKIIGI